MNAVSRCLDVPVVFSWCFGGVSVLWLSAQMFLLVHAVVVSVSIERCVYELCACVYIHPAHIAC